eukprot:RCo015401
MVTTALTECHAGLIFFHDSVPASSFSRSAMQYLGIQSVLQVSYVHDGVDVEWRVGAKCSPGSSQKGCQTNVVGPSLALPASTLVPIPPNAMYGPPPSAGLFY